MTTREAVETAVIQARLSGCWLSETIIKHSMAILEPLPGSTSIDVDADIIMIVNNARELLRATSETDNQAGV